MKRILHITLITFSFSFFTTSAQIITTIAGTGVAGFSGDGGPATAALINQPSDVSWQLSSGSLYVCDEVNNRIRVVDGTGTITTYAGNGIMGYGGDGGPATAAEFHYPFGVLCDNATGNVYVAEYQGERVRKINSSGIITTFAGNGVSGFSGDGGMATAAELSGPLKVALDNSANLYIADNYNNRIRMVTPTGIISTFAGTGSSIYSGDGGPATAAGIGLPMGVAIDAIGNVYIAEFSNNRIRMVNTSGIISTFAGNGVAGFSGDGGQSTASELHGPVALSIDGNGNICITDYSNNRIRVVSPSGIITTIVGNGVAGYSGDGGPATAAELNYPYGNVAFDATGNWYIADYYNDRVRSLGVPLFVNEVTHQNKPVIYPNPNNGLFCITGNNSQNNLVDVYNLLGERIYSTKLNASTTQVDLRNNVAGIYLYKVLTETGELVSEGKFVIQK